MALDSYSALKASLSPYLDGSDFEGREADFVTLAEAEINARLADAIGGGADIRPMVERGEISISAEFVAMFENVVKPIRLEITSFSVPWLVTPTDEENLLALRSTECFDLSKPPAYFAMTGDDLRVLPAPSAPFTALLTYYLRLPALSDENPSNWLLAKHPNVYLYGALAQAQLFGWEDERMTAVASLFAGSLDGVIASYPRMSERKPLKADYPLTVNGLIY